MRMILIAKLMVTVMRLVMNDCDSLLTEIDKVLVGGVGGEPSDVQVGPEWIASYNYDGHGHGDLR